MFVSALRFEPRELKLFTRSQIPAVLRTRVGNSDVIDPLPFMAAASVLPMRANNYVVEELIDWSNIPEDPIFQLVFPQPGECAEHCVTFCRSKLLELVKTLQGGQRGVHRLMSSEQRPEGKEKSNISLGKSRKSTG